MKKLKTKPTHQWCIENTYVSEVLAIAKEVHIEAISFDLGFSIKRVVSAIPDGLRELGVGSVREPSTSLEVSGVLQGSRAKIASNAKSICTELKLDYRYMKVRRLQLSLNGTKAYFTRMTKRVDTGDDNKTYRLKVLGLVSHDGDEKDINKLLRALTAEQFECTFTPKTIYDVSCRKL